MIKSILLIFSLWFLFRSLLPVPVEETVQEYQLSIDSEEYNTKYLYNGIFDQPKFTHEIQYIPVSLPKSFVIELGSLENGHQSVLIYDDTKKFTISKKGNRYFFNGTPTKNNFLGENKISLYFTNNKILIYIDEKKVEEKTISFDYKKKIGIKWAKNESVSYRFLNIYEPKPYKQINYGKIFEQGDDANTMLLLKQQNVGKKYNLTFPTNISKESKRSIRFEYRFEDSKDYNKSKTARGRSEIYGVHSTSIMNKWIIEFDLLVPRQTADDAQSTECITQLHEGFYHPTVPAFHLGVKNGYLYCKLRGDSILRSEKDKITAKNYVTKKLCYLEKDRWYHIKVFVKEGYQKSLMPLTKIWIDKQLFFESNLPNCYNYIPRKDGKYSYLKFGIYKSRWLSQKECDPKTDTRVYYFDNYLVKY